MKKSDLKTFVIKFSYTSSNGKSVNDLYFAIKAKDKESVKNKIITEGLEASTKLTAFSSTNVKIDLRTIKEYDYTNSINIVTFL